MADLVPSDSGLISLDGGESEVGQCGLSTSSPNKGVFGSGTKYSENSLMEDFYLHALLQDLTLFLAL
ncbi:hypothetical protein Glove_454g22 [Diversispora epigaea]|uniref:Uncharacterized protein n=1 Tax=Diversispora epigaea TaxID=1348612 RepID=A0A397GPH0_9GLOM|nr:hypothetical protein Glove_454g22 [Diversispora epigaea]